MVEGRVCVASGSPSSLLVASGAEGRACAQDAVWVSSIGSMKCTNADEVILLLKASDAVSHDLCHACVPPPA